MTAALEIITWLLGGLSALTSVLVGAKQVRLLREKTGDDSAVTTVLSGSFGKHERSHPKEAV